MEGLSLRIQSILNLHIFLFPLYKFKSLVSFMKSQSRAFNIIKGYANMNEYLRVKSVAQMLNISASTVWRWANEGLLPKPIKLTNRTTVWRADEVDAAIEGIAASSHSGDK